MPAGDTPNADCASLLWEESRRQIVRQESELDVLRNRAIGLLSVSSIVAGLFGSRFIPAAHHGTRVVASVAIALAAFGLSVLAVLIIIVPRWKWKFAENLGGSDRYFDRLDAGTLQQQDVATSLAKAFEAMRITNHDKLRTLYWWLTVACILVGVEVVAWGISVI